MWIPIFYIGTDCFIQAAGKLIVGNHVTLGPDVKIWTTNHRFADTTQPIAAQGYDFKPVILDDHVWVGANAFIMPGVELGERCVVSAGSVVGARKYPAYSVLAGNPARRIGSVLTEHQDTSQPP